MSDLGEQKHFPEVRFNKCVKTPPGDGPKYATSALIYLFNIFFTPHRTNVNVHEPYKAERGVSATWPLILRPGLCDWEESHRFEQWFRRRVAGSWLMGVLMVAVACTLTEQDRESHMCFRTVLLKL